MIKLLKKTFSHVSPINTYSLVDEVQAQVKQAAEIPPSTVQHVFPTRHLHKSSITSMPKTHEPNTQMPWQKPNLLWT